MRKRVDFHIRFVLENTYHVNFIQDQIPHIEIFWLIDSVSNSIFTNDLELLKIHVDHIATEKDLYHVQKIREVLSRRGI
jgi:hypothetical protein